MWTLVLAIPGATYWIVGDISEPGDEYYLDYMWRSPISERVASFLGILSAVAIIGVMTFTCLAKRARTTHQMRWTTGLLSVTGLLLAIGGRVTTAGGGGANIGGGMFLMMGLPVCLFLVITAAAIALSANRSPNPADTGSERPT